MRVELVDKPNGQYVEIDFGDGEIMPIKVDDAKKLSLWIAQLTHTLLQPTAEQQKMVDLLREQEEAGKVVFNTFDGLYSAPIDEIIKQPTEGLLYDLNRDKVTVLSWIDNEKWINDYAVAVIIAKLKTYYDALQAKSV